MVDDPEMVEVDAHGSVVLLTGYLSYRALRGRRDDLKLPLRSDEVERLAELERLFDPSGTAPPSLLPINEHHAMRLPVSFHDGDGVHDGQLSDLWDGMFFVQTATPRTVGERIIFRFIDNAAAQEWRFGGEVLRVRSGPGAGMEIRLVGIPVEITAREPPRSV